MSLKLVVNQETRCSLGLLWALLGGRLSSNALDLLDVVLSSRVCILELLLNLEHQGLCVLILALVVVFEPLLNPLVVALGFLESSLLQLGLSCLLVLDLVDEVISVLPLLILSSLDLELGTLVVHLGLLLDLVEFLRGPDLGGLFLSKNFMDFLLLGFFK